MGSWSLKRRWDSWTWRKYLKSCICYPRRKYWSCSRHGSGTSVNQIANGIISTWEIAENIVHCEVDTTNVYAQWLPRPLTHFRAHCADHFMRKSDNVSGRIGWFPWTPTVRSWVLGSLHSVKDTKTTREMVHLTAPKQFKVVSSEGK